MTSTNKWTAFPDALRRAERSGIDRAEFINSLVDDLAADDADAVVRGWARLTERRFTTAGEEWSKWQSAEQLHLLLKVHDEFSLDFPHEIARHLKLASEFEPPEIILTPSEMYELPRNFWAYSGQADSQGECYWTDDPEEPSMFTWVNWPLGLASCRDVLPGTLDDDGSEAYWEFSGLEIITTAIDRAIRKLDVAAREQRAKLILSFPLNNYTEGGKALRADPAFAGFTKLSFENEWKKLRPPGQRGRKAQSR